MKEYKITIEGASTLIMNRLGKDLLDEMAKIKKDELSNWEEANWEKKLYKDADNNVILPDLVLHAMIIEAGKKQDHKRLVTGFQS